MAHVRFVVFKVLFAFALFAGLDGKLVEECAEAVEWVEEHQLPTAPPHPRRQAHQECDGFDPHIPPAVSAPRPPAHLPPATHTFAQALRAPLRC
jgi:hypothetical protein